MSTADKLLTVLPLFTLERPEWTIDAAAIALGVSASTAYRYFTSLQRAGLLDPLAGGHYGLGPAIIAYDRQLRLQDPLVKVAGPVMKRLVERNGGEGVALLCRRFRQQVMCVHQAFQHSPYHAVSYERGRPMGLLRGAASLVVLAHLPPRSLRALWRDKPAAVTAAGLGESWDAFRAALKAIRNAGVLVTHGQLDKGMIGISAPIWHADRRIGGSISLVLSQDSTTPEAVAGASALVEAAAREIDAAMLSAAPAPEPG